MPDRTCSIEGCPNKARSSRAEWCETHYHRWYRHGDPLAKPSDHLKIGSLGAYRRRYARVGHPLRTPGTEQVYEHRLVLFDAIGYGPHVCHWCSAPVEWMVDLQVDHLNRVRDDNRPENLVPSCAPCNTGRGRAELGRAFVEAGWWQGRGGNPHHAAQGARTA